MNKNIKKVKKKKKKINIYKKEIRYLKISFFYNNYIRKI